MDGARSCPGRNLAPIAEAPARPILVHADAAATRSRSIRSANESAKRMGERLGARVSNGVVSSGAFKTIAVSSAGGC